MKLLRLDLQYFNGEKTEKATPRKKQDARKKGQVAKSQDINTAVVMAAVFFLLLLYGGTMFNNIIDIYNLTFNSYMTMDLTEKSVHIILIQILQKMAIILLPVMAVAMIAGVLGNYVQVGFLVSGEPMKPKLEKINPIKGFKRIFSKRSLMEFLKSILKISLVGMLVFMLIKARIDEILILSQKSIGAALITIADLVVKVGLYTSLLLLGLGLLDYIYQRYEHEKNLRMSKQDLKDEYKKVEGDPLIKSRIKQKQRDMAMRRMMAEVPNADVIITNPTHYAIALKYDESKSDAPMVVAMGVDNIAQKIKLIAKENDVVMVENRPLARALYAQAQIGRAIPEEFFKAVAEILAFVYKTKNKL